MDEQREDGGFKSMLVWKQSIILGGVVYSATANFPRSEDYALTGQMRRAAVSISSNIAEGSGRATTKDYLYFLHVARGSIRELESQIALARHVDLLEIKTFEELNAHVASVGKLLDRLVAAMAKRSK